MGRLALSTIIIASHVQRVAAVKEDCSELGIDSPWMPGVKPPALLLFQLFRVFNTNPHIAQPTAEPIAVLDLVLHVSWTSWISMTSSSDADILKQDDSNGPCD
ncbi:hypothetical protein BJ170DRAFT_597229 [Xylariales sp. AK1849]|nr:hypothetical protein BJ170DRAFT_597229 [Xylariales sp. AK1849]